MRFAAKFAVGVFLFLCLAAWQTQAAEIGYLEDFALAKDRAVPLQQLIPGTEDYYYYHCLHLQNTEQFDRVNELLTAWINRYKDTPGIREIQNRQALLTYTKAPDKSLEFIRQRLGLQFNHQRERLDEKPNLPTSLDQNAIARQTLLARAFAQQPNLQVGPARLCSGNRPNVWKIPGVQGYFVQHVRGSDLRHRCLSGNISAADDRQLL